MGEVIHIGTNHSAIGEKEAPACVDHAYQPDMFFWERYWDNVTQDLNLIFHVARRAKWEKAEIDLVSVIAELACLRETQSSNPSRFSFEIDGTYILENLSCDQKIISYLRELKEKILLHPLEKENCGAGMGTNLANIGGLVSTYLSLQTMNSRAVLDYVARKWVFDGVLHDAFDGMSAKNAAKTLVYFLREREFEYIKLQTVKDAYDALMKRKKMFDTQNSRSQRLGSVFPAENKIRFFKLEKANSEDNVVSIYSH